MRKYEEDNTEETKGFYIYDVSKLKAEKRFRDITGTAKRDILDVRIVEG